MAELKIKNTNSGNEFYFLADEVNIRLVDVDAEIFTRLDNLRDYDFRRAAVEVVIKGVWQVPPGRSHPTGTPKSAEDIWAMAVSEAANGRAVEVYPTIAEGTEGGVQTNSVPPPSATTFAVDDGGGADFDVPDQSVIKFANHSDLYIVQDGASGSSGSLTISEPGLTNTVPDDTDITLYEGYPLSMYPDPDNPPQVLDTKKGSNQLLREITFKSDAVYKSAAHIWDALSDLTKAI